MTEMVQNIVVEVLCGQCSTLLQKEIEINHGSREKAVSTVDLYCPMCKQFVTGKIQGDPYASDYLLRGRELLKKFDLDELDPWETEG